STSLLCLARMFLTSRQTYLHCKRERPGRSQQRWTCAECVPDHDLLPNCPSREEIPMKWVKASLVIVLLVTALYFAYQSFESSFNPRRGQEGKSGKPPMAPEMLQKMQEVNQRKKEAADKKAGADPSGEQKNASTARGGGSEETHKKGGE